MHKSKLILFLVVLFLSAGLLYIKLETINSNENTLSKDSTDLVDSDPKSSEDRTVTLSEMAERSLLENNGLTTTEAASKPKQDSIVDESNQQVTVQPVGNTGDSIAAEYQIRDYLSDYAYEKKSFYPDELSCTSYTCEVSIIFYEQSDDILKQVSALMRSLPWREASVDNISIEEKSAKLIIQTDVLK